MKESLNSCSAVTGGGGGLWPTRVFNAARVKIMLQIYDIAPQRLNFYVQINFSDDLTIIGDLHMTGVGNLLDAACQFSNNIKM